MKKKREKKNNNKKTKTKFKQPHQFYIFN